MKVADPQITERAASTVELLIKSGSLLGMLWLGVTKVLKPYHDYRRNSLKAAMAEILEPTMAKMNEAIDKEADCAERQTVVYERQTALFEDIDLFLKLAEDSHARHDETNGLLDQLFGLERRIDHEKRQEVEGILKVLRNRRRIRHKEGEA